MNVIHSIPATQTTREEVLYQSERTRVVRRREPVPVIVKMPLGPESVRRLRHELSILERLAEVEGVARLAPTPSTTQALFLEDLGSLTLAERLRQGPLTTGEQVALALRLARTLAGVHRHGVVHRDINPSNILLTGPDGHPCLNDFDLATTFAEERPGFVHHREIVGTLAYLAPEQTGRTGRPVDQRADLYSLGATLYELATGRPPFRDGDALEMVHNILARIPTPPDQLEPSVPRLYSDMILRLLAKEPDRRYQSAEGLAHDLARLDDGQPEFALAERDFPLRLTPPSRLIGRTQETEALLEAFENTIYGQGRGVLVAGAPGVGKTSLISQLGPSVTARRGWFVSGKFDQSRHDAASGALQQALASLGRLLLAEPEEESNEQRMRILRAVGPNAGLLAAALPEFAMLLEVAPETLPTDPVEAEVRLRLAAVELLRAVASPARPVVMVVDDLQWASASSLRFMEALLLDDRLRGFLLVGAYREAEVDQTHPLSAAIPRWTRLGAAPLFLRLDNLASTDLGTLVEDVLRLQGSEAVRLAEALSAQTGGNPFDTVELMNALRRDGILVLAENGWTWKEDSVRRYVGHGDVVDLIGMRIARLPEPAQRQLGIMACLGGEVDLELLRAASGLNAVEAEERLKPALEDGLLVLEQSLGQTRGGRQSSVRFRHDRVQQAAYEGLEAALCRELHLTIARRLASLSEFAFEAAEQYLLALEEVNSPEERRLAAQLLTEAAARTRLTANYATVERFLAAAVKLYEELGEASDTPLLARLEREWHAALYSLGRLAEADEVYASLERRGRTAVELAEATCVQVNSLFNRNRPAEAMELGMDVLRQLGLRIPEDDMDAEVERRLVGLRHWLQEEAHLHDPTRPELSDPGLLVASRLAYRLQPPAYFCRRPLHDLLVLENLRLWLEHGPCPTIVSSVSSVGFVTVSRDEDYRLGYLAAQAALTQAESRGFQAEAAWARCACGIFSAPWFQPVEEGVALAQQAREDLIQGGDLQFAGFTFLVSVTGLLDSAPTLESCAVEAEAALAFARRIGSDFSTLSFLPYRQLVRALRGQTDAEGSFEDESFQESKYMADMLGAPALLGFSVNRGLGAAIFNDTEALLRYAAMAMSHLPSLPTFPTAAQARWLHGLALAERVRRADAAERPELLKQLDDCLAWLETRAEAAPSNFLHLWRWLQAERAWACGDFPQAVRAFDLALQEAEARPRPWHTALITERAARFALEQGLERSGRQLLSEARALYEAWGAPAKVQQLEREFVFLRAALASGRRSSKRGSTRSSGVNSESLDILAILSASQTLSSETSLVRLQRRVVELLGALTGATGVQVILWRADLGGWFLPEPGSGAILGDENLLSLEEAAARALLPISAFRYVERTRQPLVVEDAVRDDRFCRDAHLAGVEMCSLLVVPIHSQGVARAVLVLENRLARGAFSADRLDAVMFISGQLAVSLDNALLYASLERKVAERTQELGNSLSLIRATLESTTDGILVTDLQGKMTDHNEKFLEMWGLPLETVMSPALRTGALAAQLSQPEQFLSRSLELDGDPEMESFEVLQFRDGRIYERYCKAQRSGNQAVGRVWSFRDITERRRAEAELEKVHHQLLEASRRGGMAEIATNVLHNVGNVLNSVNVSSELVINSLRKSKVGSLERVVQMLREHEQDLGGFFSRDPKAAKLPEFLAQLSLRLQADQEATLADLDSIRANIGHIKEIVAMQQSYARVSGVQEIVKAADLVEDSLRINLAALARHQVAVVRDYSDDELLLNTEKHKVVQILVNLIRNAKYACQESGQTDRSVTIRVEKVSDRARISVRDDGVGIAPENLIRIFNYGFTTRAEGHGFGLHGGALAAKELGGQLTVHSDGVGKGAVFQLDLPLHTVS